MQDASLLSTVRIPLGVTVIVVIAAAIIGGPTDAVLVALLAVLEISISFDNAIVNAHILKNMQPKWQQVFLTWGILIAVFGMRLVFPIAIVAIAAALPVNDVVSQALNHPEEYARNLESANPIIAAFGGAFLLMVFLNYFLDSSKEEHWLGPLERPLAKVGEVESIAAAVAGAVLIFVSRVVDKADREDVLAAGLAGIVIHLVVGGVADRLEPDDMDEEDAGPSAEEARFMSPEARQAAAAAVSAAAKGGLAVFLYLEVLDASFSFDGVIGAFAISKEIIVIAVGLGLGALYIRTLTVYLVRQGTLAQYRYLEHGAHWAIGTLAVLLFIGIEHHIPEVVTGLIGAVLIGTALASSILANKREGSETDPPTTVPVEA